MSITERALIEEYRQKGMAAEVLRIVAHDFKGKREPNQNWWQVHRVHMLLMTGEL